MNASSEDSRPEGTEKTGQEEANLGEKIVTLHICIVRLLTIRRIQIHMTAQTLRFHVAAYVLSIICKQCRPALLNQALQ